jgi:hypothetical protein
MASSSNPLGLITSNPALDAYNTGQKNAQQRYATDLAIEAQIVANAENLAGAPTRLRTLTAGADTARANADVAQRTVDSRVAQQGSAASMAGTQARIASETAPYTIDNARIGNAGNQVDLGVKQQTAPYMVQNAANAARTNEAGADVAVATAPVKIEGAKTGLRQQQAQAVNSELQAFYKSLELLNAGQTDAAVEVARQAGQTIPPAVIENSELRAGITEAAKMAQELYPNRPRVQQEFMRSYIENIAKRATPANDPAAAYQVPDAPTPPETTLDNKTQTPAQVATANWLISNGVAKNAQEAWQMVSMSKTNPETIRSQVYRTALQANFGNHQKAEETTRQAMAFIQQANTPTAAAAPAPAAPATAAPGSRNLTGPGKTVTGVEVQDVPAPQPAPAARSAGGMQGAGTRQSPFVATSQDQITWFKTSAPPGTIIQVNGQLFQK